MDSQEHLASHAEGDEAEDEDEDENPTIRCRLYCFQRFITATLLDYVPQPDPSGHVPCSIRVACLDCSFEEEHRSCTIDVQEKSALRLSPLLARYLQGQREEDPVFNLSESLVAFKLSQGDQPE